MLFSADMGYSELIVTKTSNGDSLTPSSFSETRFNNSDTNVNSLDTVLPTTQQPTLKARLLPTISHSVKDHLILSDVPSPSDTVHPSPSSTPLQTIPSRWNPTDSRFKGVTVRKFIGHKEVPFSLFDPCTHFSI